MFFCAESVVSPAMYVWSSVDFPEPWRPTSSAPERSRESSPRMAASRAPFWPMGANSPLVLLPYHQVFQSVAWAAIAASGSSGLMPRDATLPNSWKALSNVTGASVRARLPRPTSFTTRLATSDCSGSAAWLE